MSLKEVCFEGFESVEVKTLLYVVMEDLGSSKLVCFLSIFNLISQLGSLSKWKCCRSE